MRVHTEREPSLTHAAHFHNRTETKAGGAVGDQEGEIKTERTLLVSASDRDRALKRRL